MKQTLRRLARDILEKRGYRVLTAKHGKQAFKLLGQHPEIDLLFNDIVMPNSINGYELAEKAIAIRADIKTLFTSGFAEKAESRNAHVRFNTGVINKPYHQTELIKQIRATPDKTKTR